MDGRGKRLGKPSQSKLQSGHPIFAKADQIMKPQHIRWILCIAALIGSPPNIGRTGEMLELTLRDRVSKGEHAENFEVRERATQWDPNKSAVVICDMWDDHWCRGAAKRVTEMAVPMNRVVAALRSKGVIVIHSPSSVVDFYAKTPQRLSAQKAPMAKPPIKLSTSERWGTCWCWPDPTREPDLPIDDSDMGCDCAQKCTIREAWTRQIPTLTIAEGDVITDSGQEFFNVLQMHNVENVMIMGVHLNMCVLGRPFGIRQTTRLGKNVVLIRDLTDTMYNHEMRPLVPHFTGTALVVEHVEKYWCPTITSNQLVGGEPFRFQEASPR